MLRTVLYSKIHKIEATQTELHYNGSISLDPIFIQMAGVYIFEKVDIYNINNGQRFSTYVIEGEKDSKCCCLNGAAARLVEKGDLLILAFYAQLEETQLKYHQPNIILMGKGNNPVDK